MMQFPMRHCHDFLTGDVLWFSAEEGGFLTMQNMTSYGHAKKITDVKFSPSGCMLATTSEDGLTKIYDASSCTAVDVKCVVGSLIDDVVCS